MRWLHGVTFLVPAFLASPRKTTNFNFKLEDDFLSDRGTKFEFLLINGWKMKIPSTVNMTLFVDRRLLSYLFFADARLLSSWYCSLNLNGNHKTLSTANSYFYISKREKRENIQFLSYESSMPSLPGGREEHWRRFVIPIYAAEVEAYEWK